MLTIAYIHNLPLLSTKEEGMWAGKIHAFIQPWNLLEFSPSFFIFVVDFLFVISMSCYTLLLFSFCVLSFLLILPSNAISCKKWWFYGNVLKDRLKRMDKKPTVSASCQHPSIQSIVGISFCFRVFSSEAKYHKLILHICFEQMDNINNNIDMCKNAF